ncbi:uncharacterized protein LOC119745149 [Patiria miniata]|uniref:Apple domain-containing protein n=1 Tax=Patiria miniata TaxID=46514 RepID=A0A914BMY1_PATMI|nr:uncharacterized protein LOC119745149 [Patiria miniata]
MGIGAGKAIDGDVSSYSHTVLNDPHPWWILDLGSDHCIGNITVALRDDCCRGRYPFYAAVARAGMNANYSENPPCGVPATRDQAGQAAVSTFVCDAPRVASHVSFDIDPSTPGVTEVALMLAEVTVEEYTNGECDTPKAPPTISASSPEQVDKIKSAGFVLMYKGARLIGKTDPLSTLVAKYLEQCAASCFKHTECVSFDYAPATGQCDLYNVDARDMDKILNDQFMIYAHMK